MAVYLVRHAKAGSRQAWKGDDALRPLSAPGWEQARALGKRIAKLQPTRLVSSPYVRCVQTLEPLADGCGLQVTVDDRLGEGSAAGAALDLLLEVPDRAVLCSHGDVIPDLIGALQRMGTAIATAPDWRKATVWVLERSRDGVISATVWPPPQ